MDGNLSLILAFLVSISVVLALVIKFKLHPFLSPRCQGCSSAAC